MKNVPIPCFGGIKYGYVHQPKKTRELKKKIATLEQLGCTDIIVEVGTREELDTLLDKATFRDFIYFHDHSAFLTYGEVYDLSDTRGWIMNEPMKFDYDFYDTSLWPYYSAEATLQMRKWRSQEQSPFSLFYGFATMFRLPRLYKFITQR